MYCPLSYPCRISEMFMSTTNVSSFLKNGIVFFWYIYVAQLLYYFITILHRIHNTSCFLSIVIIFLARCLKLSFGMACNSINIAGLEPVLGQSEKSYIFTDIIFKILKLTPVLLVQALSVRWCLQNWKIFYFSFYC